MILENAVLGNRITLAEKGHWKGELEKDVKGAEVALANARTRLNTESQTRNLGNEQQLYDTEAARRTAIVSFVSQKMEGGLTHQDAWELAKVERKELFAMMQKR